MSLNSIVISVGQCGNQISTRFWDMVLQEHAKYNEEGLFDESLATFFRHTDDKSRNIPLGNGKNRIRELRARAVLIDMEERVINGIRASPQKELFDDRQIVLSNSGSGNNWAMGYKHYGEMYRERISDTVRSEVEMVDTLQSLFTISSTGGGTGSGLGSFVVELLQDEYPGASKFSTVVMPSADDDVVTSPYNSVLALSKLTDSADCILPVENQALIDICKKVDEGKTERQKGTALTDSPVDGMLKKAKPFDTMNNIVANLMINLTSSTRFPGSLNMDINELAVNLVPFPRIRYLLSSMTPLYVLADRKAIPRKIGQMFLDCFSRETQLMKADPRNSTYLGCALLVRGDAEMSDIRRNIDRLKPTLKFIPWNPDGWKVGLCSAAPLNQPYSLLTLANNCGIRHNFGDLKQRFMKLYRRKANLHHYTQYIEPGDFAQSLADIDSLISEYETLANQENVSTEDMDEYRRRFNPISK